MSSDILKQTKYEDSFTATNATDFQSNKPGFQLAA
jgi:hypothetical protein